MPWYRGRSEHELMKCSEAGVCVVSLDAPRALRRGLRVKLCPKPSFFSSPSCAFAVSQTASFHGLSGGSSVVMEPLPTTAHASAVGCWSRGSRKAEQLH